MIYFDNAATTLHKPQSVLNAVNFALKNLSANPGRSGHSLSQNAADAVFKVREKIADFFGASGAENVVFTANCTQSINIVLKGALNKDDHIVISDLEHNAVMRPLTTLKLDYSVAEVSFDDDEQTLKNFKRAIKPNTKMIFCTAASNVLGKILPLEKIGKLCKENKLLFAVDAAQGAGIIDINMRNMNIDYLCVAPHKGLYAPMGTGILVADSPIYKTIIQGGTGTESVNFSQPDLMPEMLESGTINLPGIIGIGAGVDFVNSKQNCILKYENSLVNYFFDEMQNSHYIFYGNPHQKAYAPVISFNFRDVNSEYLADYLNKNAFGLRAGLHCAPTAHKKIGTLKQGTVRFSPSVFNNHNEVKQLIKTLKNFKK